jgi:hypothetical protein
MIQKPSFAFKITSQIQIFLTLKSFVWNPNYRLFGSQNPLIWILQPKIQILIKFKLWFGLQKPLKYFDSIQISCQIIQNLYPYSFSQFDPNGPGHPVSPNLFFFRTTLPTPTCSCAGPPSPLPAEAGLGRPAPASSLPPATASVQLAPPPTSHHRAAPSSHILLVELKHRLASSSSPPESGARPPFPVP